MKLKDLEKMKLIEAALMLGIPIGLSLFNNNSDSSIQAASWGEQLFNNGNSLYFTLATIPRLADTMLTSRLELKTEDYKEMKVLYDKIISNLANFLKEQGIDDPVEIFTVYQYMYRNGYLSFNHHFNYDVDMKDLSKLNGLDVVRGTGVCRSIGSFLTNLYQEMGYDSFNLLVNANRTVLDNIDRQGNYPKWSISKKTNRFVKIVSKATSVVPVSNHLITGVEKDGKVYVFDPTNDAFLIKGKHNKLVLPDNKEGNMKISYVMSTLQKAIGSVGNLKTGFQIHDVLKKPTIDYDDYKQIYKNTLEFIKNNMKLFDEFYMNNQFLYADLFEQLDSQSAMITRFIPELKIKKAFDYIESLDKNNKKR